MQEVNKFQINGVEIGDGTRTYFIADVAANHDGDLSRAKDLICLAAESGADAAKFQHFQAETIVSELGFSQLGKQQSHQSKWEKSVCEVYREASVPVSWTQELRETCDKAGIAFFSAPYNLEVIEELDPFVPAYKIGSGDITWVDIVVAAAKKGKPLLIASGASSMEDVDLAVRAATEFNSQLCLMQCNTNYTGDKDNFKYINLNVLKTYRKMYPNLVLGLSDHTPGSTTVLGAVTLGATVIEKHFTDNQSRMGPDHAFSMVSGEWREMVERTRELEDSLGDGKKRVEPNEEETVVLQRRALHANKDLTVGTNICTEDLSYLRPCPKGAISPSELKEVLGKPLACRVLKGEAIKWTDIESH